jgi:hypothetical protein
MQLLSRPPSQKQIARFVVRKAFYGRALAAAAAAAAAAATAHDQRWPSSCLAVAERTTVFKDGDVFISSLSLSEGRSHGRDEKCWSL